MLYVKAKENIGKKNISFTEDTISVLAVTSAYTPNYSSDEYESAIPSTAIVANATLTGCSFVNGVFDADDVSFPSVDAERIISALVILKDTGYRDTSMLISYIPIPITVPADEPLSLSWAAGGILELFKDAS